MKKILTTFFFALAFGFNFEAIACEMYSQYICAPSPSFSTCDIKIIQAYTGQLYRPLNRHMRKVERDESCTPLANSLELALAKLPQVQMRVYRGTAKIPVMNNWHVGDCYIDQAFVSTSMDIETALYSFTGNANDSVLFQIDAFSGRDISFYSYAKEKEVVLLPGTPLKLKSIDTQRNRQYFSFVETNIENCNVIRH